MCVFIICCQIIYILTLLQLLHVPGLLYISILGSFTTYIPCYMYYIPVELLASEREELQAWWVWLHGQHNDCIDNLNTQ